MMVGIFICCLGACLGRITLPRVHYESNTKPATTLDFKNAHNYYGGFIRDGNEIQCNVGTNRGAGACWGVTLNQKTAAPLILNVEGLVVKAEGRGEIALYCDLYFTDGTHRWGYRTPLEQDPARGWQMKELILDVGRPIARADVYVYARYDKALCARFRAPSWREMQPVQGEVIAVDSLSVFRTNLPARTGFLIREQAGYEWLDATGGMSQGLRIVTHTTPGTSGETFYDVTIHNEQGGDRALTIIFLEPLPKGPLSALLNPYQTYAATAKTGEVADFDISDVGRGGLSKWPLIAATAGNAGRVLALDSSAPVYNRLLFNTPLRALLLSADIGFTPEHPDAHYRFATIPFTPSQSNAQEDYRRAYTAYMKAFPEFFKVRVKHSGIWMAFRPTSTINHVEDFGFAFKEGEGEVAWDDMHGLLTFHYTEPITWWMDIHNVPRGQATMASAYRELTNRLNKGESQAKAWITSVMHDEKGNAVGRLCSNPWCENGCLWSMSSLPELKGDVTDYSFKLGTEAIAKRFAQSFPHGVDGEYLDSAEMEPVTLDYRRSHFSAAMCPLAFSSRTLRPAIYTGLVWSEYARKIASDMHARRRFMMANCTPHRYVWIASYMDVLGTESIWINRTTGQWTPPDSKWFMYRRFTAGAKPWCFLLQEDFDRFDHTCMIKAMNRMLAWGFFPGFSQPPDKNVTRYPQTYYWLNPKYYERDRDLFKTYVPLIRKITEAGWQPLNTRVSISDKSIVCEQFGKHYVTLFNPSNQEKRFTITCKTKAQVVRELINGHEIQLTGNGSDLTLKPEEALLLEF